MCLRYDKATWQRDKLFAEEAARETIRAHRMRRLLAAASFISVVEGGEDNENENENKDNEEMEEEEEEEEEEVRHRDRGRERQRGSSREGEGNNENFRMDEIRYEYGKGLETAMNRRSPARHLETDSDIGGLGY